MWQKVLVVVFLLPPAVLGNDLDQQAELELQQEVQALDHAQQVRNSALRHFHQLVRHRHHRHHRHRRQPFLHQRHRQHVSPAALLMESYAEGIPGAVPVPAGVVPTSKPTSKDLAESILPRRHPAVAKKLGYMDQAMRSLKSKQQEAKSARTTFETEVKTAIRHMNKAQGIRTSLARTEAEIREENKKLRRLADDRLRLDRTHHHLVSSLHHIMDPKLELSDSRVKTSEERLKGLEEKAKRWKSKDEQFHAAAIAMIDERRASKRRLQEAQAAEVRAHQEAELAERQYMEDKKTVNFNVQGYRFALAKARAAKSFAERGEEETREAKEAKKRLTSIMTMEGRRVDEAMAIGKDRVQGKIRELESRKDQSKLSLSELMQQYGRWQGTQRKWAQQLASTKGLAESSSQEMAQQQQAILDSANAKVAYDAESNSDWAWDEWPGNGRVTEDPADNV